MAEDIRPASANRLLSVKRDLAADVLGLVIAVAVPAVSAHENTAGIAWPAAAS